MTFLKFSKGLSTAEFNKLSSFIYQELGIKIPPGKKVMVESRLQKRLNSLNMPTYTQYLDYLFSVEGLKNELVHLTDTITTNKTDFFREPTHFDFLKNTILPEFSANFNGRKFYAWSAGCSSGEEPYTLAMVLQDYSEIQPEFSYQITASDISTQILNKAIKAIYQEQRVAQIPLSIKRKYFLRSKDSLKRTFRVIPELRSKVQFQGLNFMNDYYDIRNTQDLILCRNVLIYFDRSTQEKVIKKLCTKLRTGGYLFIGHSESLTEMQLPLKQIRPTVFIKV